MSTLSFVGPSSEGVLYITNSVDVNAACPKDKKGTSARVSERRVTEIGYEALSPSLRRKATFILKGETDSLAWRMIRVFCSRDDGDSRFAKDNSHLTDEERKLAFSFEVKRILMLVENLKRTYNKWINQWKAYSNLRTEILVYFEYMEANKSNFLALAKGCNDYAKIEEYVDGALNIYAFFEYASCLALEIIRYAKATYIEYAVARTHRKHIHFMNQTSSSDQTELSSQKNKKVCKKIRQMTSQVAKYKREAVNKGGYKFANLLTRMFPIVLQDSLGIRTKIINKIGKSTISFFKAGSSALALWNNIKEQNEWIASLKPPAVDCIFSMKASTQSERKVIDKQGVVYENAAKGLKNFLTNLQNYTKIEDVSREFKKIGISVPLPGDIKTFQKMFESPRFQRQIIQGYYASIGQQVLINQPFLASLFVKRKNEHQARVDQALALDFISQEIRQCQGLQWSEIETRFAALHIRIGSLDIVDRDDLPCPPKNLVEWGQCVQSEEFCRLLTERWVEFQEATGQLAAQSLREALLSKHRIERKLYFCRAMECSVKMFAGIAHLLVSLSQAPLHLLSFILENVFIDLAKSGIPYLRSLYLFYPIYPEMNFKLENAFFMIFQHFFAIKYKPNAYSLEGYKLFGHMRLLESQIFCYRLCLFFARVFLSLSLNRSVFSNRAQNTCKSLYLSGTVDKYEQAILDCRGRINQLVDKELKLSIKDVDFLFSSKGSLGESKQEDSTPIEIIVEALYQANVDYFPTDVKHFFEENFGINLKNEGKEEAKKYKEKLKKYIDTCLSKGGSSFIEGFASHRFSYLDT